MIQMFFAGTHVSQKKWSEERKLLKALSLHEELSLFYRVLCKLCIIAERKKFKLIIENPYTQPHYLKLYFPLKPGVIIKDRHKEGDYYKKPSQFFFVNCEPENNLVFEPLEYVELKNIEKAEKNTLTRSLMHPQFANRFIRTYII